jgi:hypothetical protein
LVLGAGKIKAFSQGGPVDPRDNIPALLRRGEFVLTPEDLTKSVSLGRQMYGQNLTGGTNNANGEGKLMIKFLGSIYDSTLQIVDIIKSALTVSSQNVGGSNPVGIAAPAAPTTGTTTTSTTNTSTGTQSQTSDTSGTNTSPAGTPVPGNDSMSGGSSSTETSESTPAQPQQSQAMFGTEVKLNDIASARA